MIDDVSFKNKIKRLDRIIKILNWFCLFLFAAAIAVGLVLITNYLENGVI